MVCPPCVRPTVGQVKKGCARVKAKEKKKSIKTVAMYARTKMIHKVGHIICIYIYICTSYIPRYMTRCVGSVTQIYAHRENLRPIDRPRQYRAKAHPTTNQSSLFSLTWGLILATALATAEQTAAKLKAPTLARSPCCHVYGRNRIHDTWGSTCKHAVGRHKRSSFEGGGPVYVEFFTNIER